MRRVLYHFAFFLIFLVLCHPIYAIRPPVLPLQCRFALSQAPREKVLTWQSTAKATLPKAPVALGDKPPAESVLHQSAGDNYEPYDMEFTGSISRVARARRKSDGEWVTHSRTHKPNDEKILEYEANFLTTINPNNDVSFLQKCYGIREVNGRKVLEKEFIEGKDMAEVLKNLAADTSIPLKVRIKKFFIYYRQILDVVSQLHKMGVTHLDLKTSNIILSNDGRIVLADLSSGVLRKGDRTLLSPKILTATPALFPPELHSDIYNIDRYTSSLDIYTLSYDMALLYQKFFNPGPERGVSRFLMKSRERKEWERERDFFFKVETEVFAPVLDVNTTSRPDPVPLINNILTDTALDRLN